MTDFKVDNIPSTIICARAVSDITKFLEDIQNEQGLSSDLMCMILRDACSHFERKRADDYSMAIVKNMATIQLLSEENKKLKEMTELFNTEDNANDNSEHKS